VIITARKSTQCVYEMNREFIEEKSFLFGYGINNFKACINELPFI